MIKIAYIARHIPVPSETFVINEVIALQSLGVEIYPFSLLPAQKCHEHLLSQIKNHVVELSNNDEIQTSTSSSFYPLAVKTAEHFRIFKQDVPLQASLIAKMVKNNGINLIHAHFATESAWVALVASRITGVPFSFTAHAYDIFIPDLLLQSEYPFEQRLNVLLMNCDRVVTVSEYNKKHLVSKTDEVFAKKISVIHCGIDTGMFTLLERPARDTVTFLMVGRFVEKKGYEYLLRAFGKVVDGIGNVRLRIVGEGHLKPAMEELCCDLGLTGMVDFLGSISSERVAEEMRLADIFALHSVTGANGDKEGIPVSLMEAMATGLPVVSTKHSGIPELVVDGVAGFLAEEKDVESFATFMRTLADSPKLRKQMGTAGHGYVIEHFDLYKETEKLRAEFQKLMEKKRPSLTGTECSVDIILPTYRPDFELLTRAVRSIVEQTFKNWRLILVQDGNDFELSPVIDEFKDPRITYFEISHCGKPAALNFAIEKATAKYIAYLDDDDIWYPNHLEEAISCMCKNGIQFLHTNGHEIFVEKKDGRLTEVSRRSLNKGLPTNKLLWYISHINAIHERELLAQTGSYDVSRPYFIDWDMFLRLAKVTRPYFLDVITCEHYIYQSKGQKINNTISSAHAKDPEMSRRMFGEMLQRAFAGMSPFDVVDIFQDWQQKSNLATQLKEQIALKDQLIKRKDQEVTDLYNSMSWKVTKPLREVYAKIGESPLVKRLVLAARKPSRAGATWNGKSGFEKKIVKDPMVAAALAARTDAFDVLVFPVIDWNFRVQRPQQLSKQLAQADHRVFYLTTVFSDDWQEPGFSIIESPEKNVFIVKLNCLLPHPQIYSDTTSSEQKKFLLESLFRLQRFCALRQTVSIVDLPFWRSLVESLPGNLLIYDCMDHHAGFSTNTEMMLQEEAKLLHVADLVITTSQRLSEIVAREVPNVIIRNGVEVSFFARRPDKLALKSDKPVVGYFGAISEWFDIDLVISAAEAYPDWSFVLVGSTFGCDTSKAEKIPNVSFIGEVTYSTLPGYLYAFDVCIIPFRITELTLCTNPVKVYEYLSAGKPVVATAMPEVKLIADQLHVAENDGEFIKMLRVAMSERGDAGLARKRAEWAKGHDWRSRVMELEQAIQLFYPKVSVIVLTYNNIDVTKACLHGLLMFTEYPDWEIVVVDNASSDGTPEYLRDFESRHENVRVILNDSNLGFAAGNNVGLREAQGEYFVILNNDTFVTKGWLFDLVRHLRKEPSLGLVGPVTNSIGNEAQIDIAYRDIDEMHLRAREYTSGHPRQLLYVRNVAFFCVAMRRDVWERVGGLDEDFTVGFFEDDDYCRRINAAGLKVAIAEDVFVHHEHSASFNVLSSEEKKEIFERNKKVYEQKWGEWVPHVYRR